MTRRVESVLNSNQYLYMILRFILKLINYFSTGSLTHMLVLFCSLKNLVKINKLQISSRCAKEITVQENLIHLHHRE